MVPAGPASKRQVASAAFFPSFPLPLVVRPEEAHVTDGRAAHGARACELDAILAKAAAGDAEAFRLVYTRYRAEVARLVYRMMGVRSDLDDLVQEVFFQVYKSLKDFGGRSKF